ncbi:SphA family protein [Novosphingobium rosa]|uniref:SphA family protein n=1 Tax=Novosphingobium rosa TaxID=76978 RepID=UPI000832D855|nr:transporter [Novosphingobium rosa]
MRKKDRVIQQLFGAAVLLGVASAQPVSAGEVGGGVYPNGAEGYTGAALPPPGTYLLGYYEHYSADRFNDGQGQAGLLPAFHARADAAIVRLVHVTGQQVLGASWGMQAIVPFVNLRVGAAGMADETTGAGDVILDPVMLGWHFRNGVHVTTGLDITMPTGSYKPTKLSNIGRNYWSIEPVAAVAYYGKQGFSLDAKLMYDVNFTNNNAMVTPFNPTGAAYRSGNEFHIDYAAGQQIGTWKLGVAGYYYAQTTRDKVDNAAAQATIDALRGFKGEVFAAGPSVAYRLGKVQLIGTWQHEFHAEYRPAGDKFWLKAIIPLTK